MRYENIKVIDKQFKSYCNDEKGLEYFYHHYVDTNYGDDKFRINIGDYDGLFMYVFLLNHFNRDKINYEKITGLGYNNKHHFLFEWTDEKIEMVEHNFKKKTQRLFEKFYANDVEDKLNKIHQKVEKECFDEEVQFMSYILAINKIRRSKIYNFGLGLKLNMRDAGIT